MIPDAQTMMLPLLKLLSDDQPHFKIELVEKLGNEFNLTEPELNELLPNSKTGKNI